MERQTSQRNKEKTNKNKGRKYQGSHIYLN